MYAMSDKKLLKKVGSLKMEPLKGRFFDIKPSRSGPRGPVFSSAKDFGRFALIAFMAFFGLNFGHAYIEGRNVIDQSTTLAFAGYEDLEQGIDHLLNQETDLATQAFVRAGSSFKSLEDSTDFLTQPNDLVGESYYLEAADLLLGLAMDVSTMGQKLSQLMASVKVLPEQFLKESPDLDSPAVMDVVNDKQAELSELLELATGMQQDLANLNIDLLPTSLHDKIHQAREQVGQFIAILLELDQLSDHVNTLLGDRVPHRYLILLQNNHELRATGGFIGSYMIVDVNDGKITKMEPHDIYASDGQIKRVLSPPPGIDQIADRWFMRDANYSPDFPTSAEQLMWFLEVSRGPSVDTVIAIDQTLVESALSVMGEIQLERFPVPITQDNFNQVISFYTEAKLSETDTPKQLLFDMIPVFKERLSALEDLPALFEVGEKMISQGHVQMYSKDPGIQSIFESYGLSGRVLPPQEKMDYLSVVSTSIGGNKSDGFINTQLSHLTTVDANGGMTNELSIQKTHQFSEEDGAVVQSLIDRFGSGEHTPGDIRFILGEGENLDYMRVYVPLGSELQSIQGVGMDEVEVFEELGYTMFGFIYGPVKAGENEEVKLTYSLPFDLEVGMVDNYRFVAERQAGAEMLSLRKTLKTSELLEVQKSFPEPVRLEGVFDETKLFMSAISAK